MVIIMCLFLILGVFSSYSDNVKVVKTQYQGYNEVDSQNDLYSSTSSVSPSNSYYGGKSMTENVSRHQCKRVDQSLVCAVCWFMCAVC